MIIRTKTKKIFKREEPGRSDHINHLNIGGFNNDQAIQTRGLHGGAWRHCSQGRSYITLRCGGNTSQRIRSGLYGAGDGERIILRSFWMYRSGEATENWINKYLR